MPADAPHEPYTHSFHAHPGDPGTPAITVAEVARRYGWTTKYASTVIARLEPPVPPLPEPMDGRTPAYPRERLLERINTRPGRGANLRGHR